MLDFTECAPIVDASDLPEFIPEKFKTRDRRLAKKNLYTLCAFSALDPGAKPKRAHFGFYAMPVEILGGERVEGIRFERTKLEAGHAIGTGEMMNIPCGLVVAAIGYRADPVAGCHYDAVKGIIPNDKGRIEKGHTHVGWRQSGTTGVIW